MADFSKLLEGLGDALSGGPPLPIEDPFPIPVPTARPALDFLPMLLAKAGPGTPLDLFSGIPPNTSGFLQKAAQQQIPALAAAQMRGQSSDPWTPTSTPKGLEARMAKYGPMIDRIATEEGVHPALLKAIAVAESSLDPYAKSPTGPKGMFQFTKKTGLAYGLQPNDRYNPELAARAAARLIRDEYKRFGRWDTAIGAYNQGAGRAKQWASIPESRRYVPRVLKLAKGYGFR